MCVHIEVLQFANHLRACCPGMELWKNEAQMIGSLVNGKLTARSWMDRRSSRYATERQQTQSVRAKRTTQPTMARSFDGSGSSATAGSWFDYKTLLMIAPSALYAMLFFYGTPARPRMQGTQGLSLTNGFGVGSSTDNVRMHVPPPPSSSSLSSSSSLASSPTITIESLLTDKLVNSQIRYYMYDDVYDELADNTTINWLLHNRDEKRNMRKTYGTEAFVEHQILELLERHPLRTHNPKEATLFIPPIRMGAGVLHQSGETNYLGNAIKTLTNHPQFVQRQGKQHALFSLDSRLFDALEDARGQILTKYSLVPTSYAQLRNVVVIQTFDAMETQRQCRVRGRVHPDEDVYRALMYQLPTTFTGMSLGLYSARKPTRWERLERYREAVFDEFGLEGPSSSSQSSSRRKYWFQYDTSSKASGILQHTLHNLLSETSLASTSTSDATLSEQTKSLFGTTAQDRIRARFCVVIRSNTKPFSYQLLSAVQAGCIPIVISDYYDFYAPTMKSTLRLSDYTVSIREQDFLRAPLRSLMDVAQSVLHTPDILQAKVEALRFAQRVTVWNNPEHEADSLFVQALLEEISMASKNPSPELCGYNKKGVSL